MIDSAEFEVFMRNYQNMVYTTAYRLTASHAEAQDIAQETFLKAYERYDELRETPTVGGWLRTVATNLSLNHLSRYRQRWRFFSELRRDSAAEENPEEEDFAARTPAPESQEAIAAQHQDTRAVLESALAHLPSDQRTALVLFHFDEMPYQAIADRLGISLAKVKIDILRGREALRRRLAGRLPELEVQP